MPGRFGISVNGLPIPVLVPPWPGACCVCGDILPPWQPNGLPVLRYDGWRQHWRTMCSWPGCGGANAIVTLLCLN